VRGVKGGSKGGRSGVNVWCVQAPPRKAAPWRPLTRTLALWRSASATWTAWGAPVPHGPQEPLRRRGRQCECHKTEHMFSEYSATIWVFFSFPLPPLPRVLYRRCMCPQGSYALTARTPFVRVLGEDAGRVNRVCESSLLILLLPSARSWLQPSPSATSKAATWRSTSTGVPAAHLQGSGVKRR